MAGKTPYWWQRCIPRYGNWGGVGWSAGIWNNDPAATNWSIGVVDDMDALFKLHDWAYQLGLDRDDADRRLVNGLKTVDVATQRGRAYRIGAMIVFTAWPYVRRIFEGGTMRKIVFSVVVLVALAMLAFATFGLAVDVPPLTAAELSPEAHPIWLILAGEGFWGAIVIGVAGFVYKIARPYILTWVKERKLAKLYLAGEACAAQTRAVYVEGMKAANADGKLTEDEKLFVFTQCKQGMIAFMKSQGEDIIKEYGDIVVDALIELIVSRMGNPVLKAVAAPLPDSASLPIPELEPGMPVKTVEVSG